MGLKKLGKLNFESPLFLLGSAGLTFALALSLHAHYPRPEISVSKQDSAVNISTLFLKMISLGNKRLIADTIWIQTLIESDLEVYKGDKLNSWMYLRFKSIADLDPLFYENYLFGGQYLAIVKDDTEGAAEIMERGLEIYPEDYKLNFNAGFNYYFEMVEIEKGLAKLEKIKDSPLAPKYLPSLLIKLRHTVNKDPEVTLGLLIEAHAKAVDTTLKNKLAADIYAVKATIDLECLNSGRTDCQKTDAHGRPYLYQNGKYHAELIFNPYKLHYRPEKKQ